MLHTKITLVSLMLHESCIMLAMVSWPASWLPLKQPLTLLLTFHP